MSLRSLRWQIQLWHAGLLVTLVTVSLVLLYSYERGSRISRIDSDLTGPTVALLPRYTRMRPRDQSMEKELEASGHYIRFLTPNGTEVYASPDLPSIAPVDKKTEGTFLRWNGPHRELITINRKGDFLVIGRRDAVASANLGTFALELATIGSTLVALGWIGGYFIANRAIRPIRAIGDAARLIASGGWHERIPPGQAPAELEELRNLLNDSFDRLATAYEHQRLFTADASHELSTPVSVVLAQTQHALARPRTPEEYIAALAACRRAGERMRALSRDLLDLAAYDARERAPRYVECDLIELARESLALVAPLAASRQAVIEEHLEPLSARVDPLGLSQVLVNLLNNALLHNRPEIRISLSLRRLDRIAEYVVEDNGAGIPPESLPRVFDRFFRVDSARSRDGQQGSGSGLGLAISRQIAMLHGGDLLAENRPEGGARFTLRFPAEGVAPVAAV